MSNVTPLGVKPDRFANQLAMHEAMKDELRAVLVKYQEQDLHQAFLTDACAEICSEAQMGPMLVMFDGEPA
jgi:hypothetical protein